MLAVREMEAVVRGLLMDEMVKARMLLEVMLWGTEGKLVRVSELRLAVVVKEAKVVEVICEFKN